MSELDITNDELGTLKKRATTMGITFHPNISLPKLKIKVQDKLDAVMKADAAMEPKSKEDGPLTSAEYAKVMTKNTRKAKGALVRIQVTCMNPDKKSWPGEVFSAGSAKLGTWKKFVPFGSEHGYMVPQIILEMMQERKFSHHTTQKNARGNLVPKSHLVPEFAINILPQLTTSELKDLANQQAASGSVS